MMSLNITKQVKMAHLERNADFTCSEVLCQTRGGVQCSKRLGAASGTRILDFDRGSALVQGVADLLCA